MRQFAKLETVLALSFVVAGCWAHETQSSLSATPDAGLTPTGAPPTVVIEAPSPRPMAQQPTPAATVAEAPTVSPELKAISPGDTVRFGPFAWPKGGSSAILSSAEGSDLVWISGERRGKEALDVAPTAVVLKDVTHDGEPELVIFGKDPLPERDPRDPDEPQRTNIVGLPSWHRPARMWLLEQQILGAKDEISLGQELATLGTFGPVKDTPPTRLIVRLPKASPAELAALVGPAGLKLCKRQGEKKSCTSIAQKSIDAKRTAQIAGLSKAFANFSFDYDEVIATKTDVVGGLQPAGCMLDSDHPDRVLCFASDGGPEGVEWIFEKTSSGLRLAEVGEWAEDG